jgi:glyoxylase I family protein
MPAQNRNPAVTSRQYLCVCVILRLDAGLRFGLLAHVGRGVYVSFVRLSWFVNFFSFRACFGAATLRIRATIPGRHISLKIIMRLHRIHHAAIIAGDYERSKRFYTETLGLRVVAETYRAARRSYKLDLALPDGGQIELFSFPGAPARPSWPEAQGLRHLAFAVTDIAECVRELEAKGVAVEPVRVDELTGKQFTFFADPDGLPLELYEG